MKKLHLLLATLTLTTGLSGSAILLNQSVASADTLNNTMTNTLNNADFGAAVGGVIGGMVGGLPGSIIGRSILSSTNAGGPQDEIVPSQPASNDNDDNDDDDD